VPKALCCQFAEDFDISTYIKYVEGVRTTLRLDDDLLEAAREYAQQRGETLTAVFDRALRTYLAASRMEAPERGPPLPVFDGRGLQPGVDLDDAAALQDLMAGS
jgi:hypothetical protein